MRAINFMSLTAIVATIASPSAASNAPFRDCPECVSISLVDTSGAGIEPFYMATFETNWREYLTAVREAGCALPTNLRNVPIKNADKLDDDYAVSGITRNDALCFAQWLSNKSSYHYRLPTPEEWKAASRTALASSPYDDPVPSNLVDDPRQGVRSLATRPVLRGRPSNDGIYGLVDGVGEMTSLDTPGDEHLCKIYKQPQCREVNFIGLAFGNDPNEANKIFHMISTESAVNVGFRVVRER